MAAQPHVNDVNTELLLTIKDQDQAVVDISSASVLSLLLKKPNGMVVTKTPTLKNSGTDGKMRYLTIAGDFDQSGEYAMQGRVTIGVGTWTGSEYRFVVSGNLG